MIGGAARRDGRVAGLLLAAGPSSRMLGGTKLLLDLNGRPLVRWAAEAAAAGGLDPVVAVVGHRGEEVAVALEGTGVHIVRNPEWYRGQGTSLAAGLRALAGEPDVVAVAVLLGDEPEVEVEVIERAVAAWRRSARPALRTVYRDRPGHPVVLGRSLFPSLSTLEGDEGAAILLWEAEAAEEVEALAIDRDAPPDVDDRADYQALLARMEKGRK